MGKLEHIANTLAKSYTSADSSMTLEEVGQNAETARTRARKQVADAQRAARAAGLGVITAAVVGYTASETEAAPLGQPVPNALPESSSPIDGYGFPTGTGIGSGFTGADGSVDATTYFLTSQNTIFTAEGNTITNTYNVPFLDSISGIALKGYDGATPLLTLSDGTSLYEGRLDGSFSLDNTISLTGLTSDVTDVDFNLGNYFIATQGDGIRKVESDGSTVGVNSNAYEGIEVIAFKPDTYSNPMLQSSQNNNVFWNVDTTGITFGTPQAVNVFNGQDIEGIVYHQDGMGIVQNGGVALHGVQPYQEHMQDTLVPEPTAAAMIVAIGAGMLAKRKYTPKD